MIPDIDSSGWSTDPRAYGMSPREYIQSESRATLRTFLGRAPMGEFFHFTGLTRAADHWVVSPNNDTIYSVAVVDTSAGFTLSLPDVGSRFLSAQVITENHMTPFYLYGGGEHRFEASDFDTRFAGVGIRCGTDGRPADVARIVDAIQPRYRVEGVATGGVVPEVDLDTLATVRAALLKEWSRLPNTFGAMVKHTDEVRDWEFFTYVTAGGYGLSADENAMYVIGGPVDAQGGTCYRATFPTVPARAFFSITAYGPAKYLMTDSDNILSSLRSVVTNPDGSFDVVFGGEACRGLAPNFVATPEDGWSILLRAYQPDVDAFTAYRMPEFIRVG
jgi:hypothetical protein